MMKIIASILIVFLTVAAWAQSNDSTSYNKFDIGFTFSPDYSYRILKTNTSNSWIKDTYDTLEVPRYGFTSGLNINFQITSNFFISSGILFADKGERTKKYTIQPVNNYTNHYYYLDVPLKANFYLGHRKYYYSKPKKVKLFLTAGGSVNVYLKSRTITETDDTGERTSIATRPELSRINFSLIAGLGMHCPLTDKWYFKLEPNYRRSVTPIANTPIKKYPYSFGLNVGLFCKL